MPGRISSGLRARMDAAALKAVVKHKPSLIEQIAGLGLIGVWAVFLMSEYFHMVEHETTLKHTIVQWAPLIVGLALLSRTAFHGITNFIVKLKGLGIVSKED